MPIFCAGIKKAISKITFPVSSLTFVSSMDYEMEENEKVLVQGVKVFLKTSSIKFISVVKGRSTIDILKHLLRIGIKAIIVGVERNIETFWLGRIIDNEFIDYIEQEKKKGNFINTNDFQTLVVESPLMKKRIKIKDFDVFDDPERITTSILLKIKEYEIY